MNEPITPTGLFSIQDTWTWTPTFRAAPGGSATQQGGTRTRQAIDEDLLGGNNRRSKLTL
jgi:hypothetical protein